MKRVFSFTFLLTVFITVQSQYVREFSLDTSLYITELTTLFGTSLMDEEELIFDEFVMTWDSLDYSNKNDIMHLSEMMRQRSCRPRPQYIMLITILEEFYRHKKQEFGFDEWMKGYTKLMEDKSTLIKQINQVNQSILSILQESKLYSSVSLSWRLSDPVFSFSASDKLILVTGKNNLIGLSSGDSIVIHEIEGYFDLMKQMFYGNSGLVYWERAGFQRESVYAELNDYSIELRKMGYKTDSAVFHYDQLLGEPALGVLEDKITQVNNRAGVQFPQFTTYQSNYQLNNILTGINYSGAISMQGADLAGTSSGDVKAVLDVIQNDTLRAKIRSNLFLFNEQMVRCNHANLSVYLEDDSIYHPDLLMNYNIESETFRFTQSQDFNSQGPYANSYHRIDMVFNELKWKRSEPIIQMQAALGTALGNGLFESYDFYNQQFYEGLHGMEYEHPLVDLWNFGRMLGGDTFALESYAQNLGMAPYMVRQMLMLYSKLGFVYFDFEGDLITLRAKLYDYIDASIQARDYDVIKFISRMSAGSENASLNLSTKDLTIHGIPTIFLSDSQNVKIVPSENSIIMKRNRDFQFDGIIDAGLFKFYGKNFFFEYDNFRINLQNIDSLSISAKTGERDQYGNPLITSLDNKIENITGELLIDAPFNKSGLMDFPEYPVFTSRENSYVYFDEKEIQDGVYERERFYFELAPFSIDSLDNFRREAMKMDGKFVSAGILPDLEMEMSLRPDNSLGFYMSTDDEGIPIFDGKATFYSDIEMSSAGLHGYGSLDYINSTTWSDDFLFHPDSLMTTSRRFLENEAMGSVSYPYVENDVTDIQFYPTQDLMSIDRIENAFNMYNDSISFGGDLELTPSGLTGNGTFGFPDARFNSELYNFWARNIHADSAGVELRKDRSQSQMAFVTDDISVDVDLNTREGSFSSRADYTLIDMPINLYETRLDQITWLMDEDQVVLTQVEKLPENQLKTGIDSLNINAPGYVSKHGEQDSLNFVSPLAYFNYRSNIIEAKMVPFVEVGDTYVFPDSGNVQIQPEAKMTPLKDARILANKDSRFHLLHDANLTINSRVHFRGSADYDYIDEFGEKFTFRMHHVEIDTSVNTFGIGDIAEEDSFNISPYFDFQGQVSLDAPDSLLTFAGGVKLTHDCSVGKLWLKFDTRIDPDSVIIPVERRMQNLDLNNIYAGTLKARDSIHMYPTFLSGRKDYFDRNITFSDGVLFYDKATKTYEIASIEKLADEHAEGNYLALRTDSCQLYSEGRIDLNLAYGQIGIKTVGEATHSIDANSLDFRLLMGMNFHFSPIALDIFGRELDSLPNLDPVDITTDFYSLGVKNFVGTSIAERMESELGLYGAYSTIPDSLNFSLLFNDIPLKWNQETRSYRHNGKVGIGTIGNIQVNKYVDAYVEMVERGSGDIFDIYLMVDENTWYYMAYSPGGFQVLSSNADFNADILAMPDKERRVKSSGRQRSSYIYSLASNRRLSLFLDRFMLFENQ